jgi:radical SAM superfamily enzyme YgiQ (UPF0313 family)
MKKLLLINPVGRRSGYLKSRFSTFSPLGLAYVAAVTPSHWKVKIIDENFETFEFEEADLVGITAFTSNINRSYEIAQLYRKRKIKVIMGGIHASMIPDEVMRYTDSVIVGEVEGIWQKAIKDFENNNLSSKYIGPKIDLEHFKIIPRRDLLHSNYLWQSVQTSRGCPFNCEFCSVSRYLGKTYRCRKAEDVLEELKGIDSKYIFFTDDNLIGYNTDSIARAKQLFKGMITCDLNKKWWMQTSINSADDEEVVELAAKAGCMFVFIGFETISLDTLKGMKKGVNIKTGVNNYRRVVDTFHKYGIGVLGAFIIGNDYETSEYYKELANFIVQSNIDMMQLSILTPLPGTNLMRKLLEEDRLVYRNFPQDWDKYRFSYVVHHPHEIDERTIYIGDNYIKKRLYSFPTFSFRLFKSLFYLKNLEKIYAVYKFNQALKTSWQNAQYYDSYPKNFE